MNIFFYISPLAKAPAEGFGWSWAKHLHVSFKWSPHHRQLTEFRVFQQMLKTQLPSTCLEVLKSLCQLFWWGCCVLQQLMSRCCGKLSSQIFQSCFEIVFNGNTLIRRKKQGVNAIDCDSGTVQICHRLSPSLAPLWWTALSFFIYMKRFK